jgi:hypothetical protein
MDLGLKIPARERYGPQIPGGAVQPREPHRLRNARRYFVNAWFGTIRTVYAPLQESVRREVHVLMTAG